MVSQAAQPATPVAASILHVRVTSLPIEPLPNASHIPADLRHFTSAFGAGSTAKAQGAKKILIIASNQDVPNFDPHVANGYSAAMLQEVSETLAQWTGAAALPLDVRGAPAALTRALRYQNR